MAKVYRPTNSMKSMDCMCCFTSSHYTKRQRTFNEINRYPAATRIHVFLVKRNCLWNSLLQGVSENLYTAKQGGPGSLLIPWTFRHPHRLNITLCLCSLGSSNSLSCKAIFGSSSLWAIQLFLYGQQCTILSLSALQ